MLLQAQNESTLDSAVFPWLRGCLPVAWERGVKALVVDR